MAANGWSKGGKEIMIIYIAGKMSGLEDLGQNDFDKAEKLLTEKGHIVINPAKLPHGLRHESYMQISLAMIDAADAVYMLKTYSNSNGANIEFKYAVYQGKNVYFEGLSEESL